MLSEQWDEFEIYKLFEKELQKRKKKGADNGGCGLLRKSSPSTPVREVDLRGTSTADQAMGKHVSCLIGIAVSCLMGKAIWKYINSQN